MCTMPIKYMCDSRWMLLDLKIKCWMLITTSIYMDEVLEDWVPTSNATMRKELNHTTDA